MSCFKPNPDEIQLVLFQARWSNGPQPLTVILTIAQKFALQTHIVLLVNFYFLSTQKQNHYTVPAHENVQF